MYMKNRFVRFVSIAAVASMLAGQVAAQTFTTLYSFTATYSYVFNSDGAGPAGDLVLLDNILYGTAQEGGSSGFGTVFKLGVDGGGFTTLHDFTSLADEGVPEGLTLSSNVLYGTGYAGGGFQDGSVFKVNADGTGFTNLYIFSGKEGMNPHGLVLSSGTLYGTTEAGPSLSLGQGTVFRVNIDGTGFRTLHNFDYSDGASPFSGLILSGNTLYGTTYAGGYWNCGTVFGINTDGTGFRILHSFNGSDGANPGAGLTLSHRTLYGTTSSGGSETNGTVFSFVIAPQLTIIPSGTNVILTWLTNATEFSLQSTTNLASPIWTTNLPAPVVVNGQYTVTNTISGNQQFFRLSTDNDGSGTGFTSLYSFTASSPAISNSFGVATNSDGAMPMGDLVVSSTNLYGTATAGGVSGRGTVFKLSSNGTSFTTLHSFTAPTSLSGPLFTNSDGIYPSGLILSGNTLYGTASGGGTSGNGTVFSILLPPP